jgi:phosphoglycolate phosphatase
MDIKAIIFDKDGTIADFGVTFNRATKLVLDEICQGDPELMEQTASALDYDLSSNMIGKNSVIIAGSGVDIAEALSSVLEIEDVETYGASIDEIYGEICLNMVEALPGATKALERLNEADIPLGVATNDSEENAINQLESMEVDHLFDHIFGADSGYGPKPGTGMIDTFVEQLGLRPEQVLMVGDSIHDMEAGRAAGVKTCAVETGPATREELLPHADIVLSSISELPDYLNVG